MGRALTKQIVIRVSDDLLAALTADAEENGRTLAQSVRFLLRRSLAGAQGMLEADRFERTILCTTDDCDADATSWVVLFDCEDDPCTGHGYCRSCSDILTGVPMPSGFLGHRPTFAPGAQEGTETP